MKIRNPTLIRIAGWSATRCLKMLFWTIRHQYYPLKQSLVPADRKPEEQSIYAMWHENLLLPTITFGRSDIAVLISQHADGKLLDSLIGSMGMTSVKGSSTRGGAAALRKLIDEKRTWRHLAVTPDGPRGPRRVVQPGIIYVAARTGMAIVPFGFAYRKPFRMKSWDRFAIPKPFSRAVSVCSEAIFVPETITPDTLEPYRLKVQLEMDRLNQLAEEIVETGIVPKSECEDSVEEFKQAG
jgi:lysophospholipid acyltransferase (LPLAT)-like uncharacterized protein